MASVFDTGRRPQWCPGCGNYGILAAVRAALAELGLKPESVVAVAGIGCHGRVTEYLGVNAFHAIHGRAVPVAVGVKLANPSLKVIVHTGDGDAYSIGLSHLLHAARRNVGIAVIVHNNMIFALTTGQAGPTTPKGVRTRSTPSGNPEEPFNPILLALASGATFVARGFSDDVQHLKELIKRAVNHRGFAIIDVIQPCPTFYDVRREIRGRLYKLEGHDPADFKAALNLALEAEKIPLGVLYDVEKPAFEENFKHLVKQPAELASLRKLSLAKLLARFS
ncbi:MAG: thiamine pyrophosphate-dependent enzyme [Thermofilaceae archaeon]